MRTTVLAILLVGLAAPVVAQETYVRGYTTGRGTYVEPHYRSSPNNSTLDNYSTRGNVNPHTGAYGSRDPY